tara:strand:+ start:3969 stop:4802 length:834 start_codon:yes stop_codon:yes gene_type:complete
MIETAFFGKNLCNLLSNEIIKEFNTLDSSHTTEIVVVDVEQFTILKGSTSINTPINYSKLFRDFVEKNLSIEKSYNVIDLIEYGIKSKSDCININSYFDSTTLYMETPILNLDLQGKYLIDNINNVIFHNNSNLYSELSSKKEYLDYLDKPINDNKLNISEDFYGMDLSNKKIYETYLKYIAYNLLEKQICKDIRFLLYYEGNIENLNWETMSLSIESNSMTVNKDWTKSLILDLFDFNINHIKKHLSLNEYDFKNDIISKDRCWEIRDKTSEMILF